VIELSIPEVVDVLKAGVRGSVSDDLCLPAVSIDTRTLREGECFLAIKGPHYDGHDFLPEALRRGAAVIMHSGEPLDRTLWPDRVFIKVEETQAALQVLAHYARRKWGKVVLVISGSMGKTTTREFTATLLAEAFKVYQSPRNLNNQIGVPLSLLQVREEDQLAVLELGMNHPGEIRQLARICAPDVGLLTNVGPVHLEFFSDVEEIASAKGELLDELPENGKFFFNADDPRLCRLASSFHGDRISFAVEKAADVQVTKYAFESFDRMVFQVTAGGEFFDGKVPFVGRHFLYSIAAAVAVARSFGVPAESVLRGLGRLTVPQMRGRVSHLDWHGTGEITVWDDTYNSNPEALASVLDTVAQVEGFHPRILALGSMLELGTQAQELHRRSGHQAAQCGPDLLITVGHDALCIGKGALEQGLDREKIFHFETSEEAGEFLIERLAPGAFLLLKGSRGVAMEVVLEKIQERSEA